MTEGLTAPNTIVMNRSLLSGGLVLLAVGGVLCMAGGLAATVAVAGAARDWIRQWDEPPSTKARRRYAQARAAAAAGADVWKQNARQSADAVPAGSR
jgi:hypothetical protein